MSGPLIEELLERERDRVEEGLRAALDPAPDDAPAAALAAAARYAIEGGGKRLRPILCIAAWGAFRDDRPAALYRLAAALELIHTYSLVHDDLPLMDDDEIRRGRPATHVVHGVGVATLAGAALIPRAARVADAAARDLGLDSGVRTELVTALCRAAGGGGMVGGQILDLEAEGRAVSLEDLEAIHRRKTGALLTAAPVIGGIAAGAGEIERDALTLYGTAVGLAFQVADDILDVTGSTAVLGKTAGRDSELDKATYPALAGMDASRVRAREQVEIAVAALDAAAIESKELRALARYAVERDR